ncbi:MAG: hypothetical protein AAGL49_14100, partial [Pseudomonadota bacterium]
RLARAGYRYPALLEVFCAADHGSVRRFEHGPNGVVRPVLSQERNQEALAWGLRVQQGVILRYAETLLDAAAIGSVDLLAAAPVLRDGALRALELFAETPSRDEAECYGGFPHSRDQAHAAFDDLARRLDPASASAFLVAPGKFRNRTSWRPGTAARSAPPGFAELATRLLMWRRIALERGREASGLRLQSKP